MKPKSCSLLLLCGLLAIQLAAPVLAGSETKHIHKIVELSDEQIKEMNDVVMGIGVAGPAVSVLKDGESYRDPSREETFKSFAFDMVKGEVLTKIGEVVVSAIVGFSVPSPDVGMIRNAGRLAVGMARAGADQDWYRRQGKVYKKEECAMEVLSTGLKGPTWELAGQGEKIPGTKIHAPKEARWCCQLNESNKCMIAEVLTREFDHDCRSAGGFLIGSVRGSGQMQCGEVGGHTMDLACACYNGKTTWNRLNDIDFTGLQSDDADTQERALARVKRVLSYASNVMWKKELHAPEFRELCAQLGQVLPPRGELLPYLEHLFPESVMFQSDKRAVWEELCVKDAATHA